MVQGVCWGCMGGLGLLPCCAWTALCYPPSSLPGSPPCHAPLLQEHPSHLCLLSFSSSDSPFAAGSLCSTSRPHAPSPRPSYHRLTPRFCDLWLLSFSCLLSLSSMLLFPRSLYPQHPSPSSPAFSCPQSQQKYWRKHFLQACAILQRVLLLLGLPALCGYCSHAKYS